MYECIDCHFTFKAPKKFTRTSPYAPSYDHLGCPVCAGDYRELTVCGMCGNDSICLHDYNGKKICTECAIFAGLIGED